MDKTEPRKWLYGLTADEWLHLASEGQDSEVGPCCGEIGDLRDALRALTVCQGSGEDWIMRDPVMHAYEAAVAGHETLAKTFPLLHRVIAAINEASAAELAERIKRAHSR